MRKPRISVLVASVAALLVALLLAACGSGNSGSSAGTTGASSEAGSTSTQQTKAAAVNPDLNGQITIGAALPLTGGSATIGKDQVRGAELAVDKINQGDGVLGKKLAVEVEDTQSDTVPSVQAARKLVSVDHVPVVIGEFLSNHTIAIGKYVQKQGVVHINPGSSSTDIEHIGSYSFSTIGLDDLAGKLAAEHLYKDGSRKIAFLGPNNAYGSEFARVVESRFKELGGTVTESILYTEGESSYRSELERIQGSDPDSVVYATYAPDDVTINKEAYELGMDPSKFYGIYLSICVEDAPTQAIAGQRGQDLAYVGSSGQGYVDAYKAKYGEDPATPYGGYVYDAVMMAAKAMNEAKSDDPAKIRDALLQIGKDYPGATGSITFDQDRQRESAPYAILTVSDSGKLVQDSRETVSESGS